MGLPGDLEQDDSWRTVFDREGVVVFRKRARVSGRTSLPTIVRPCSDRARSDDEVPQVSGRTTTVSSSPR